MNLEKQIKRHVIGPMHQFFAVVALGFEDFCRKEIAALSDTVRLGGTVAGGVEFHGRLIDLYRANLHLRTATRILMRLDTFKATHFSQLEKKTGSLPWMLYLPEGCVPACKVSAHHSRLYHTGAVAQRIARSISAYWSDQGIAPAENKDQALFVRLEQDAVTLSLDSSGAKLYQRGLKTHSGRAPLRETLAAGILQIAGFRPDRPLVDPMCGTGTFSLEAAMMAKHVAPGLQREFAFMHWPAFRPAQWRHLQKEAAREIRRVDRPLIWASDQDAAACTRLTQCMERNHLDDAVQVRCADFFSWRPDAVETNNGLIVLNPPYGLRFSDAENIGILYERIGDRLRTAYRGWKAALILPDRSMARRTRLSGKWHPLHHGGLPLILMTGRI